MKIYRGKFSDYNNKEYILDFNIPSDTESITDIKLGGSPFVVELEGDSSDLFKPIRCSTASATIVSDKYLFDLYSNKNDIDIKLYDEDDNIEWIGIVKPLIFNMGYDQELEEIEIECVDYINILDEIYLDDASIISNKPIMTFGELFNMILHNNTKYKYLLYPNIFGFNMLDSYSISTKNFIDDDCKIVNDQVINKDKNWSLYKILEEMCRYMNLTLSVDGETLVLIPYLQLKNNITYKKYSIGNTLSLVGNVSKSDAKQIENIYSSSDLELCPVLNKFTVKTKTNKVKELLPDFMDDDNLINITKTADNSEATFNTNEYIGEVAIPDSNDFKNKNKKTYDLNMKFFKCKSDKVKSYKVRQSPLPANQNTIDQSNLTILEEYADNFTGLINNYCTGIIDFKKQLKTEGGKSVSQIIENGYSESNFYSSTKSDYVRYLALSKGKNNRNLQLIQKPLFKIESDNLLFTNKMALQITGSLINSIYHKAPNKGSDIKYYYNLPTESYVGEIKTNSNNLMQNETRKYFDNDKFCNLDIVVKIGNYYFHNIGNYFKGTEDIYQNHFFREGWWNTINRIGQTNSRLQFDNMSNDTAFHKKMDITDNSYDSAINQSSAGYWIKLNANENQGNYTGSNNATEEHITLPESFIGKLEILFYPNSSQSLGYGKEVIMVYNDDDVWAEIDEVENVYYGSLVQFLSDFKVKLVIPRDMTMTEEEWNSETEISAIVDSESMKKATEITCEIHSDFGKVPAYSNVIGNRSYTISNIAEDEHKAEEWIVYAYTKQYSDIRKILNTKVKEAIKPYSIITMKDRNHFAKMVVDSYKIDYRTAMTDVKFVEIADI